MLIKVYVNAQRPKVPRGYSVCSDSVLLRVQIASYVENKFKCQKMITTFHIARVILTMRSEIEMDVFIILTRDPMTLNRSNQMRRN